MPTDEDIAERQQATPNRTDIRPAAGDAHGDTLPHLKRKKMELLRLYNTGQYTRNWRNEKVANAKERLQRFRIDISHFDIGNTGQNRAEKMFMDLPDGFVKAGDRSVDTVAAAIAVYVANEMCPDYASPRWDPRWNPGQDTHLAEVAESLGIERRQVKNVYAALISEVGTP